MISKLVALVISIKKFVHLLQGLAVFIGSYKPFISNLQQPLQNYVLQRLLIDSLS